VPDIDAWIAAPADVNEDGSIDASDLSEVIEAIE